MFRTTCAKCGGEATVEMNMEPLCSKHAFEAIQGAKGVCPQPRRLRGTLKIRG